jgi:hypothetical protein
VNKVCTIRACEGFNPLIPNELPRANYLPAAENTPEKLSSAGCAGGHSHVLVCEYTLAGANLNRTADEILSLLEEHAARLHALLLRSNPPEERTCSESRKEDL